MEKVNGIISRDKDKTFKVGQKIRYNDKTFQTELNGRVFTIKEIRYILSEYWIVLEEIEGSFYPYSFEMVEE